VVVAVTPVTQVLQLRPCRIVAIAIAASRSSMPACFVAAMIALAFLVR
jgi:hypothetical protein